MATFDRANGETVESQYDMLVGADGVNSRVRLALQETVPDFTVRQVQVMSSVFNQFFLLSIILLWSIDVS